LIFLQQLWHGGPVISTPRPRPPGFIDANLDRLRAGAGSINRLQEKTKMSLSIIVLFIVGCITAYKAFNAEDPKQKKLFGLIALVIGGMLFYLGNFAQK
jgi:hypothetical protein